MCLQGFSLHSFEPLRLVCLLLVSSLINLFMQWIYKPGLICSLELLNGNKYSGTIQKCARCMPY